MDKLFKMFSKKKSNKEPIKEVVQPITPMPVTDPIEADTIPQTTTNTVVTPPVVPEVRENEILMLNTDITLNKKNEGFYYMKYIDTLNNLTPVKYLF